MLPRNILWGIRRLHSETSDEEGRDAGKKFSLLFWSIWSVFLASVPYHIGRRQGVQDLKAQLPEAKMGTEREALRKEEEELKDDSRKSWEDQHCGKCRYTFEVRRDISRRKRREVTEKIEALIEKGLEHLKQRVIELEADLATQRKSIETDRSQKTPLEIRAISFKTNRWGMPLYSTMSEGKETTFEYPICSGEIDDPRTGKANVSPSVNVVPQVANQILEVDKTPESLPRQDKSTAHTKPDTTLFESSTMKTRPTPASSVVLKTLSAEGDAKNEEMNQIKQAKEALKSRERELEAQVKNQKKRIQEFNAPKSDRTWPVVQGVLVGSALALGVMASIFRN